MPKDEAYYEAEQKIEEALQSGATELDLRDMKLTELPESIGQLKQLHKLNLGHDWQKKEEKNQLTTLPDSLGQLTQLTELDLSENQLTTLPDSLGQLAQLTELNLSSNQLTALPDSLGQLSHLSYLNLSSNQLMALPDSLGQLSHLIYLNLSSNQLTALTDTLGQLTQLRMLNLSSNQLTALPGPLSQLTQLAELNLDNSHMIALPEWLQFITELQHLSLSENSLTTLPEWLGQFTQLLTLDLNENKLIEIPYFIGDFPQLEYLRIARNQLTTISEGLSKLSKLKRLYLYDNKIENIPNDFAQFKDLDLKLDDNPLNPALQSAYNQGLDAVKAYLRSLEQNAEPLYEAKLVLVGEGNVGKTTLLKALKGPRTTDDGPREGEPTTHGVEIDIHGLKLPHPNADGVEIQLNAWDFGGQDVYRVTHQFFFSRRSLYLLVWEPRRGVQQGQVEDWLNMIRLRVGDDARVIIVSTHCKTGERIARIDQPVFKGKYGDMIVGFHEVDSLVPDESTGEMVGIAELKKVIAEQASQLEQMGMPFNLEWKAARDELIARDEPHIPYATFVETCARHNLSEIDTTTLARIMHDLGYIVHYGDDEKLCDDIVLKPQWLTKAIGFVLEDRATAESEGILPDKHLYEVWHDHQFKDEPRYTSDLYPFFLRLMEKYDVSYRLPEGDASLIAQHVPQERPKLPWLPEENIPHGVRRIAMICAMEDDPPGLVPWMIVRTHDYATEQTKNGNTHWLHWDKGMFLTHSPHGEAMLEKRDREFHVYTQAIYPEYLMTILQETLQKLINDNWPGLEGRYRFTVPCRTHTDEKACKGRFNIQALRQFLAEGDSSVRCQECSRKLSITELLLGFEERRYDMQWDEIRQEMKVGFDGIHGHIEGLESRIANYFMATMRAIADETKDGPRLFTFHSREVGLSPSQLFSRPLELQLWCEAEGCQHPVIESGKGFYPIDIQHEWVKQAAPYANFALKVLATVAPIAAPAINSFFGPKTTETWGIADQLSLASAIIGKLPAKIETSDRGMTPGQMLSEPERSGILALHHFITEVDPTQAKLGLHRVHTYTGDYRWLCKHHYDAWQPNIPDVISAHG